ncbi:hypothetical protein [Nocardia sp. NPDC020380]|uniref:hypothetical protein n=1 Tax=Nocardia sp. NPDC020380 TaxID=3364309 RepID=UPI0037B7AE14
MTEETKTATAADAADAENDIGVHDGGSCDSSEVTDVCWDSQNYATCSNGEWIVRPCASGTVCQDDGNGNVTCGWGDE